jgi:myo-inositol 2-dehydrogenase / D-chiro-inositol 1-dehydrogenase
MTPPGGAPSDTVGVAIVGAGFIAETHLQSLERVSGARVVAVAGRTAEGAAAMAARHGVPASFGDYRAVLELDDVDLVCVASPNDTHRPVVVDAAAAGKHVMCEKPLARTLEEADDMIAATEASGVLLLYGEGLGFAPKYRRAIELAAEGAFGNVFQVRHGEQHFGPHSDWFWQGERAGGGVMMDMGCHSAELIRILYGRAPIESVTATLGTVAHADRTDLDDHALATVTFRGGRLGLIEASWARPGGMNDTLEIVGDGGVAYVDLLRGSSIIAYSEEGYGYAVEKASSTRGWSYAMFEESWNYGMPQEMQHFVDCVRGRAEPLETGADGRVVLEVIYAAYLSAGLGRTVRFPLELTEEQAATLPYLLWKNGEAVRA